MSSLQLLERPGVVASLTEIEPLVEQLARLGDVDRGGLLRMRLPRDNPVAAAPATAQWEGANIA